MKRTSHHRPSFALSAGLGLPLLVALLGCGPGPHQPVAGQAKPPDMPDQFKNSCDPAKQSLRPLVVEWPATDRAALESQAKQGALVVRYESCQLEVLRRCQAPKKHAYGYTAITPKDEVVSMKSADDLRANIPVYAAKVEAKLAERGELSAAMKIVGEWGSQGLPPAVDQLSGECDGATHLVSALTVGAFRFAAGAGKEMGAGVSVLGAGVSGSSESATDTLSQDGDPQKCAASKRGDPEPPDGCGALLRLELVSLLPAGEGIPTCGPGTRLVGKRCEPIPKPEEVAPEDQGFVDSEGGKGWALRCYQHMAAGALPYARAACKKALELDPKDPKIKGAILFNYGMVEHKGQDPVAACDLIRRSLAVRPNPTAKKRAEEICAAAKAP
ncbi:MAG: hypothetical protein JRI23_08850 [Deltaproteobacteria bacterium]|jgi:hypothetical protein|nr:hypothetical protein [Deltaproteobacteria bacterium]MBW2531739.1 hypothetical protein [Deltaproteobacteria bacterium]